jgi:hypothetical protein
MIEEKAEGLFEAGQPNYLGLQFFRQTDQAWCGRIPTYGDSKPPGTGGLRQ